MSEIYSQEKLKIGLQEHVKANTIKFGFKNKVIIFTCSH